MFKPPRTFALAALALFAVMLVAACTAVLPISEDAGTADVADEAAQPAAADASAPEDVEVVLLPAEDPPFSTQSWSTDFSRRLVPWTDILSGGPPKDGIPAINNPTFADVESGAEWLADADPVIVFEQNEDVRGYPLAILIWHEIVNDVVGDMPVAVTFCPLCNASIVFDATLDGQALDFGTTGKLRNSDLVMYDRQTESWWQQFTGESIVGELAGRQLAFLPSQVLSYGDFRTEFPDALLLERPPAQRSYGRNPYVGYDTSNPFLFRGEIDSRLRATERVVGLELDDAVMAYAFADLADVGVVNDVVAGAPVAIFHKSGTASALDGGDISTSRDVGSVGVFSRLLDGRELTFSAGDDGTFVDAETESTWNILGQAVDGELVGSELEQLVAFDHFWFAWSAFFPDTGLYGAGT